MRFNERHEWASLKQDIATVGISEFALKELGNIVYVELPKVGSEIKEGDEVVVLESTKSAVDIYSPLSGKIVEVNNSILEKINQSPENEGWLFKIQVTKPKELETLMDKKSYLEEIQSC